MSDVLKETNFPWLGKRYKGKVRDVYEQEDTLTLITTDRMTGFDRLLAHVPHKGQVLNQISAWWFEQTKDIIPNHVLAVPDPNVTVGKKCKPIRVEGVVRGYLTGVTDTAIWTRYSRGVREFGGVTLPDGMRKNERLPHAIFDPTTKEDVHDRALTPEEMIAEGFVTREMFESVKAVSLDLFERGQQIAAKQGLILVDTKYEFGLDRDQLTLIDEIHTPDSSRYWYLDSYPERFEAGKEPEYFDKEFLRLWFKEHCDPYKDKTLPEAPHEKIEELSRRYVSIYEQITGEKFVAGEEPILERLERNLGKYKV
ncbi:phosphoribosylaminoimidazolesuccinocarboxamide synthase [Candidatus Kaiserbacteria bacterium]|nr:phosphoribosylaminoimidazolesuccinocarboxamide synthase [Candidatus Kaiserbacteria bacterium]